jgi:hypothetical protein
MVADTEIRGLLDLLLARRKSGWHDNYIYVESILGYMRKREFSDDVVDWMGSKLREALSEGRPLSELDGRRLLCLAKSFDEELNLKHASLGISQSQYAELNNLYMDALDTFSSHKFGRARHSRHHLD